MPKRQIQCGNCGKNTDTGHLTEHQTSCKKQKTTCDKCGKSFSRARDHRCAKARHTQLSEYIDTANPHWSARFPDTFEHGLFPLAQLARDTKLTELWESHPPTVLPEHDRTDESRIYMLVLSHLWRTRTLQLFENGKLFDMASKEPERKREAAAEALYRATVCDPAHGSPIYTILNIWLGSGSGLSMEPPQFVYSKYNICETQFELGINVTPTSSFVDLHYGKVYI